ncbi:DUF3137 domain-containing protein [Aestuariispira insulae]|uniref:DUF3137 domain-containing protein n=1 Tax=Aestuariispira insulae TaxID=1461337 RepID=UPI0015F29C75|nr:DUF3137 domain-containing protein [Aestuariispira insulae]
MSGVVIDSLLERRFPGFAHFVQEQLSGRLRKLEPDRRAWLDRRRKAALLGWAAGLALAVWVAQGRETLLEVISIFTLTGGLAGFICAWLAKRYLTKAFEGDVQAEMLGPLCYFMKLGFERRPDDFHLYGYQKQGLVPDYDGHDLRNRIYGTYDGVDFECVELALTELGVTRRLRDRRYYGVLFRLSAGRRFEGRTVILDRSVRLDSLSADFREYKEQDHPNSGFTRIYQTLGTDPAEAGQLLPDDVVSGLVAIRHKSGVKSVRGAFVNGNFLLAVEYAKRPFDVDVEKTAFRSKRLIETFQGGFEDLFDILEKIRPISL